MCNGPSLRDEPEAGPPYVKEVVVRRVQNQSHPGGATESEWEAIPVELGSAVSPVPRYSREDETMELSIHDQWPADH